MVVLTYKLWNRLGANRDIVGKTMRPAGADYGLLLVCCRLAFRCLGPNWQLRWRLRRSRLITTITG